MYAKIQIFDLRGTLQGFVCSPERDDWTVFLEALDTDDGERLMRALRAEMPRRIAVVNEIAIREAFRGQNLGRKLIEAFLRQAEADVVLVSAAGPARAFFRVMGFLSHGTRGLMVLRPGNEVADGNRLAA